MKVPQTHHIGEKAMLSSDNTCGLNEQGVFERPGADRLVHGRITVYVEYAQRPDGLWKGGFYLRSKSANWVSRPSMTNGSLPGRYATETLCREASAVYLIKRIRREIIDFDGDAVTGDERREARRMVEKLQDYCNSLRQTTLAL